jgi:hypothetical protein
MPDSMTLEIFLDHAVRQSLSAQLDDANFGNRSHSKRVQRMTMYLKPPWVQISL